MSSSTRYCPDGMPFRFSGNLSVVFFALALVFPAWSGFAQEGAARDSALTLADSFFKDGLYQEAKTEYLRFLHFNPGHPAASRAGSHAAIACFLSKDTDGFVKYGRQSIAVAATDAEKKAAAFSFAEWCLAGREYGQADETLDALLGQYDDPETANRAVFLLGVSALYTQRWEKCGMMFAEYFKNTEFFSPLVEGRVLSLLGFAGKAEYRDPEIASVLSAIVPGLGQMYAGDFASGINSMAINAGSIALLTLALVNVRIPDAVMLYVFIFNRFYVGSAYHAKRIAQEYNARKELMIAAGIMNLLLADSD